MGCSLFWGFGQRMLATLLTTIPDLHPVHPENPVHPVTLLAVTAEGRHLGHEFVGKAQSARGAMPARLNIVSDGIDLLVFWRILMRPNRY